MVTPKYHLPEIEVWYVLPAIRRELVLVLRSKGLSQKDIAGLLHVTEAAVSQYLQAKRGRDIFPGEVKKFIHDAATRIKDSDSAYAEIQQISEFVRTSKALCQIHMDVEKGLKGCDVCYR